MMWMEGSEHNSEIITIPVPDILYIGYFPPTALLYQAWKVLEKEFQADRLVLLKFEKIHTLYFAERTSFATTKSTSGTACCLRMPHMYFTSSSSSFYTTTQYRML
jgi:hypothetical protein